jgi:hypothetical protein
MTNVSANKEKVLNRRKLFELGVAALEKAGWQVEKIPGVGKSSVRRIVKGAERYTVSIRTTQDTWIAFPRTDDDAGWITLDDVDYVVAVTVDDKDAPTEGQVFFVDGNEMRERFDRGYRARLEAGHSIPRGRGVWISMFVPENPDVPTTIGGGIALQKKPLLTQKLDAVKSVEMPSHSVSDRDDDAPLTIAEAKRRLAQSFGVEPDKVKIMIEG